MPENAVSASAKGASFLILLQVGSRAITFALNQILLRFLSPELLGISVQLELFKIAVEYFSREALRVAAERRSDGGIQAAINISYLAVFANIPLGFTFAHWYIGSMQGYATVPYFVEALRVNQLAAFVELLMEPAFTAVQHNMLYKARAVAEGLAVVLKTLSVFGFYFWANYHGVEVGVLPFAIGELAYSATQMLVYWLWTIPVAQSNNFSLLLRTIPPSPQIQYLFDLFSKPLLWLIGSLFFQTGIKWLLTEGDKLLIATLASLEVQGMYALSANYGGLIARMLFQPIEISSRNLFANLCASSSTKLVDTKKTPSKKTKEVTSDDNIQTAADILTTIMHLYSLLSLLAFTLAPTVAPLLLQIIAGSRWTASGAGRVLSIYCYYIPFLAFNGVTEAFVAATATAKDLRNQSFWMGANFAVFAASAYVFLRPLGIGAEGLIFANCVNMAMRIAFNMSYIKAYFAERGVVFSITETLPNTFASATGAVPLALTLTQDMLVDLQRYGVIGTLLKTAMIGGVYAALIAFLERQFLLDCWKRFRS